MTSTAMLSTATPPLAEEHLELLHARAEQLALHPTGMRTTGFRADCPLCGGHGSVAVRSGHTLAAVAWCHRCQASVELLRALGGRRVHLGLEEQRRLAAAQAVERERNRAALAEIAGRVRGFAAGDIPDALMWDAHRLPAAGMLGDRAAFVIEDDSEPAVVVGLDLYAMPGTRARQVAERAGLPKLLAARGSTRGLWPRPHDVPDAKRLTRVLFAVEGAPCAATMLGCGFGAVSFANAAGLRDHEADRVARVIGDRTVIVISDADAVGRAAARGSVGRLRERGVAAKAIDLAPDRNDGTDVADLLRRFGDRLAAAAWLDCQLAPHLERAEAS